MTVTGYRVLIAPYSNDIGVNDMNHYERERKIEAERDAKVRALTAKHDAKIAAMKIALEMAIKLEYAKADNKLRNR